MLQISLIIALMSFAAMNSSCGEECPKTELCLRVNPNSCPGADIDNAFMKGTFTEYRWRTYNINTGQWMEGRLVGIGYGAQVPMKYSATPILSSTGILQGGTLTRFIKGDVDRGTFKSDVRKVNSYSDMFLWKYGRLPTQEELDALTHEEVRGWYRSRYMYHGNFTKVPPENVSSFTEYPFKRYCFTLPTSSNFIDSFEFEGEIEFPDGSTCELKKTKMNEDTYDLCTGQTQYHTIDVKQICNACN